MKKIKLLIFSIIFTLSFLIVPITKADIGPKPTLSFEIKYDMNSEIEVDFLKPVNSGNSFRENYDEYFPYSEEVYNYLKDKEFDGYISGYLTYGAPYGIKINKTNDYFNVKATYRYPRNAKIIIIDKTNKKLFITDYITQRAFDAKVLIDLTNEINNDSYADYTLIKSDISVREVHNINKGIFLIFVRIVLTLLVELLILLAFRYKTRNSYLKVTFTNIVTQTVLSILMFFTMYTGGALMFMFIFIIAEIFVILTEAITYAIVLKEHTKERAIIYALVANIATIIIGFLI